MPPLRRAATPAPWDGRANCASEPVAAAELSADQLAIFTKSLAQRADLDLQIPFRDDNPLPSTAHKLVFGDQRSVGLQQDQKEIESACSQLDRSAIGNQLALSQLDTETTKFDRRSSGCQARPMYATARPIFAVEGWLAISIF